VRGQVLELIRNRLRCLPDRIGKIRDAHLPGAGDRMEQAQSRLAGKNLEYCREIVGSASIDQKPGLETGFRRTAVWVGSAILVWQGMRLRHLLHTPV